MCAAVPGPVRLLNDSCHWSTVPVSDFVSVAVNVPANLLSDRPLVVEIGKFFRTRRPPVSAEETLEIFAFMEAADESVRRGGAPVKTDEVMAKARAEVARRSQAK